MIVDGVFDERKFGGIFIGLLIDSKWFKNFFESETGTAFIDYLSYEFFWVYAIIIIVIIKRPFIYDACINN